MLLALRIGGTVHTLDIDAAMVALTAPRAAEAGLSAGGAAFLLPPWHFGMKLRRV